MKKVILVLAIVALFAASAMADVWPTVSLAGPTAGMATLNLSVPGQITLGSAPYPAGLALAVAAVGASPIGDDYVLSTQLHFDPANPTTIGLVARASTSTGYVGGVYSVSLNPVFSGYLSMAQINYDQTGGALGAPVQVTQPFSIAKDYKLVFNVKGSSLAAAVYDGTTLVASTANNSTTFTGTLTNGGIGVLDLYPGGDTPYFLSGTFLNPTVNPVLMGDANLDGKTDATDLNTVLSYYNLSGTYNTYGPDGTTITGTYTNATWLKGDFNGDSKVDATDLNTVLSFYNQTGGSLQASVGSTVPEPSTICLALGGFAMLVVYWLRKRR